MNRIDIDKCLEFSQEGVSRCEKMLMESFGYGGPATGQGFLFSKFIHQDNIECLERLKRLHEELERLKQPPAANSFFQKIIIQFRIEKLEREIISNLPKAALQFVHSPTKAA